MAVVAFKVVNCHFEHIFLGSLDYENNIDFQERAINVGDESPNNNSMRLLLEGKDRRKYEQSSSQSSERDEFPH